MRFIVVFAAILTLLLSPVAQAGSGRFVDGKFDIFVTIHGSPTFGEMLEIKQRFTQASELLWDATDGQARFGEITFFTNDEALEFADINLTIGSGMANAGGADLGVFGESIDLFTSVDTGQEEDAIQTIVHEFAHYAFDVRDEYDGPGPGGAECVQLPATACLMDDYKATYDDATEFCYAGNHDFDGNTGQTAVHHMSCWELIQAEYPFMNPIGAPHDAPPEEEFVEPTYTTFSDPLLRVVFVLDESGSMNGGSGVVGGGSRIADLNNFAKQFIDLMGTDDVELGIVTYDSDADTAFPVALLDGALTVTNAKNAVPSTGGGQTNIGGGLALGRDLLTDGPAPGPLVMILMTDGFHNFPPGDPDAEPIGVLPSIVSEGIHVHTVGLGDSTNETLLSDIAQVTGGIFWKANNGIEFEPIFASIASLLRAGSILDAPQTHFLPNGFVHTSVKTSGTQSVAPVLHPVFVEKGNRQAEFHLGWAANSAQLELGLVTPGGVAIQPAAVRAGLVPNVRLKEGPRYRSLIVTGAEKGLWNFAVFATANPAGTTYTLQPTVINPDVRGFANAERTLPAPGKPVIHLEASVRDRLPVTNISVYARMTDPAGATRFVPMWDDGDPMHGDESAGDGTYSANVGGITANGTHHFEVFLRAAAGNAVVIEGDEPPPAPDNRKLYTVREFQRNFAVDVVIDDFPGGGNPDPGPDPTAPNTP